MRAKRIFSKLLLVVIVSCIVGAIYLIYFFLIGVPKTQARNYYNLALIEMEHGDNVKALEYLELAKTYWNEGYINDEISKLN